MDSSKQTRREALGRLVILPALAGALAFGASAAAQADNRETYKYQDKPGPHDQKCADCRLFRAPSSCRLVNGHISPHGWCTAWYSK